MGHIDGQLNNSKKVPENIGVLTSPDITTGAITLPRLIKILRSMQTCPYIITGNEGASRLEKNSKNVHIVKIKPPTPKNENIFVRIKHSICLQWGVSNKVMRLAGNVDIWIFLFAESLVLPMLIAKLLRKRVVFVFTGSGANVKTGEVEREPLIKTAALILNANYHLADRITLYSESLIKEHRIQKHRNKISIAHLHFVDFDRVTVRKRLDKRGNLIGYIGRLHKIKGVLNFVEAIPAILKERSDVRFLIGGDGELREKIRQFLDDNGLANRVKLTGWIPNDELPNYLNELKLLVIPSYTETGPYIAFEAMACGTPVLATPVGVIPDIIKDGETGFIMENNSPECIARNVIRALDYPNLEGIVPNALALVEREFTFEKAVESYRGILSSLSKG